ncbi:MAG TPA: LytR C-terminal domain-containing protein [Baekduia sp.]|nr:LytR C-terminal domain-containing protein [Baekduia sp.]
MSSILALSVSDKIDQYGAYAGLASVLGLAVLSLLYFAQAREVKRLREWAGRSPERAAEVQERAVAAAQQRAIVAPQRPATPVGAPAPAVDAVPTHPRPAAATPAGQAQGAPAVAPAAAAAATAAGAATATPGAPAAPVGAGGADGPGQPTTAMPAANGAAAASAPVATPPVRPGQPLRVPGATTPPPSRLSEPDDDGGSRLAVFGAIGAIVVVAIVAVVLLTGALGGGDTTTQSPNTIGTPSAGSNAGESPAKTTSTSATPAAAPAPGSYTVAVLNGTTVPGLARGVANRWQNTKFKIGNVTNAATQDRSATLVEFAPGHRAEADAVAKAIDVGRDAIQPLSAGSKTIAGDQATVVVTVGSDQNTSPQTQTTP